MKTASVSNHNGMKVAIIGSILAMAFIGGALVKQRSGETPVHTKLMNEQNESPHNRQNLVDLRKCLEHLRAQSATGEATKTVRHSEKAQYHYYDKGVAQSKPIEHVSDSANAIQSAISNQPHKGFWVSDQSMALVYSNNVAVTMDVGPVCQVTNVYEPTLKNEIHPFVQTQIGEKNAVSADHLCTGYYRIKGVAVGTYLNYDTNTVKVATGEHSQIDAPNEAMDDYKKWQVEFFEQTIMNSAVIKYVYRIKSAKLSVQKWLPYLTAKDTTTGVTNEVCSYSVANPVLSSAATATGKGLVWQIFQVVNDAAPVAVKLPPVFAINVKVVLYNYYAQKCLCIMNDKRFSADGVKLCDCTDPHAVLIFESVAAPTT